MNSKGSDFVNIFDRNHYDVASQVRNHIAEIEPRLQYNDLDFFLKKKTIY